MKKLTKIYGLNEGIGDDVDQAFDRITSKSRQAPPKRRQTSTAQMQADVDSATSLVKKEATPFSKQMAEPTSQVSAGGVSQRVTRPDVRRSLEQVESLLDKIRDGASGNADLEKIVNKFLVDIMPFME